MEIWWLSSWEIDPAIQVQNLNEAVCISHRYNTLGKDMNKLFFLQMWINGRVDDSLILV